MRRVTEAIGIPAGIVEFRRIWRRDIDLADLDLRRAAANAGLGKVGRRRADAAVVGDRYAVDGSVAAGAAETVRIVAAAATTLRKILFTARDP